MEPSISPVSSAISSILRHTYLCHCVCSYLSRLFKGRSCKSSGLNAMRVECAFSFPSIDQTSLKNIPVPGTALSEMLFKKTLTGFLLPPSVSVMPFPIFFIIGRPVSDIVLRIGIIPTYQPEFFVPPLAPCLIIPIFFYRCTF